MIRYVLAGAGLAIMLHLAWAANERTPLKGVTAVRIANYGAPSKLFQQREEVGAIVDELAELRKKPWRRADTKMRCYSTVFLLDGNHQVAIFRLRPEAIVERPVEKGDPSYSLRLAADDLPRIRKLLTEIPPGRQCD
jgi:hypothetical protein